MNQPKMTHQQAIKLWNSLTPVQRVKFNDMLIKMGKGELMLSKVNVDDNETIQNIVLDLKDAPSKPVYPFYKHFHEKD